MENNKDNAINRSKYLKIMAWVFLFPVVALATLWSIAALWIDISNQGLAIIISISFTIITVLVMAYIRPWHRALLAHSGAFLAVLIWWLMIPPQADRDWLADVARVPEATLEGNLLTVKNIRNFSYRSETDYIARWNKRTYDLTKIRSLDMFLVYWGDPKIAHPIFSWGFDDGKYLAISIETRKEKGESYSSLLGFFRQYELYYVMADERDVVKLRTHHRGEQVYLYRMNVQNESSRKLLMAYLEQINALAKAPQWYNALSHNCTTMVQHHNRSAGGELPWNWRILLNGYLDEYLYEYDFLKGKLPFAEMRKKSFINKKALAVEDLSSFSTAIRKGLWEE